MLIVLSLVALEKMWDLSWGFWHFDLVKCAWCIFFATLWTYLPTDFITLWFVCDLICCRRGSVVISIMPLNLFWCQIRTAGWGSSLAARSISCSGRKVKSTCCLSQRRTVDSTKLLVSKVKSKVHKIVLQTLTSEDEGQPPCPFWRCKQRVKEATWFVKSIKSTWMHQLIAGNLRHFRCLLEGLLYCLPYWLQLHVLHVLDKKSLGIGLWIKCVLQ